jgi:chemotaxis signal transduction protein
MNAYCVFRIGERRAGLEVSAVRETIDPPEVSPVPLAPPFVKGFFNLRGEITALIDLVPFVGGAAAKPGRDAQAVIIEQGGLRFAAPCWEISMFECEKQNFTDHPQAPVFPALEAEVPTERGVFHALNLDRLAAAISHALQFSQLLKSA